MLMDYHRFLDEAGDTTFYGKGKKNIIGTNGVSNVFILGMIKVKDPLLNLADYFCWTIQRVFERGEIRYYNFIKEQVKLVIDLYDTEKYNDWKNHYDNKKNPLTVENKISPLKH